MKVDYTMSPWKKTIIAGLISYIDAGSIVAGAAGLSMWQQYLGMDSFQMGVLAALSSNTGGAALGALIGGKICDKYGRKFVYNYALLLYMIGVLLIVCATNYPMFLIGYLIVGLTVGADIVASWTFIAEEAPSENRAKHCGSAQFAWMLGPAIVLSISIPLNEMFGLLGNRIVFAHLILVAAFIWYQRLRMPESTEWKKAKETENKLIAEGKLKKVTFATILKGQSLKTVLFLCGIYTLWNIAASTTGFFMPYIYEHVGQMSNTMALILQIINFVVCVATAVLFMYFADKVNRRNLYRIFGAVNMLTWMIWCLPSDMLEMWMIWAFTLISTFSMQQQFYQLWSSELFPARYRATAQGFTFFITRFVAAIWGFAVPIIMSTLGFQLVAIMIVFFSFASWFIGAVWAPDDRGKTLEEITKERYGSEIN